jgi:hypothetical protein
LEILKIASSRAKLLDFGHWNSKLLLKTGYNLNQGKNSKFHWDNECSVAFIWSCKKNKNKNKIEDKQKSEGQCKFGARPLIDSILLHK